MRGFHEVGRGAQGASRVAPGKLGFNGRGEGNASFKRPFILYNKKVFVHFVFSASIHSW